MRSELLARKAIGKKLALGLTAALLTGFVVTGQAWWGKSKDKPDTAVAEELMWEDLVPEGFVPNKNPLENMSREQLDKLFDESDESKQELAEIQEMMNFAPTRPDLDGKRVKIPGYVVPLDFDGQTKLSEFLLVPYYGACIHTPPPPANQVVHAKSDTSVTVEDTYAPVWAIGTLRTETITSELAEAGYKIEIEAVEPYETTRQ